MEALELVLQFFGIQVPEKSPYEIAGKDRDSLAALFAHLGYRCGAEIGVFRGVYSEILCAANPTVKHYCVDPYKKYLNHSKQTELDEAEKEAYGRLLKYNAHFIRASSVEAANQFSDGELDYVYIDANHEFPYVVEDIRVWERKVRSGGIVSGHDYYVSSWKNSVLHVVPAVVGWTQAYKIHPWFVLGNRADVKADWSKRYRTWFWVKP